MLKFWKLCQTKKAAANTKSEEVEEKKEEDGATEGQMDYLPMARFTSILAKIASPVCCTYTRCVSLECITLPSTSVLLNVIESYLVCFTVAISESDKPDKSTAKKKGKGAAKEEEITFDKGDHVRRDHRDTAKVEHAVLRELAAGETNVRDELVTRGEIGFPRQTVFVFHLAPLSLLLLGGVGDSPQRIAPGFDFRDFAFVTATELRALLPAERYSQLKDFLKEKPENEFDDYYDKPTTLK